MFQKLEIFQLSEAMARHAGKRQALVAKNMAHSDTPGYRARDLVGFKDLVQKNAQAFQLHATRASHLNGTMVGSGPEAIIDDTTPTDPNGNSVSLETEMLRAVEVKRQHDRALAIYKSSLTILRASLGRG